MAVLTGGGAGAQPLGGAVAATLGELGWLAIAAGVITMALRPRADASLLGFDDAVDDTAGAVSAAVGRRRLPATGCSGTGCSP